MRRKLDLGQTTPALCELFDSQRAGTFSPDTLEVLFTGETFSGRSLLSLAHLQELPRSVFTAWLPLASAEHACSGEVLVQLHWHATGSCPVFNSPSLQKLIDDKIHPGATLRLVFATFSSRF